MRRRWSPKKMVRNKHNTPGIIKYPFFSMTAEDKDNLYVCINTSDMRVPDLIRDRAVCIKGDIGEVLDRI